MRWISRYGLLNPDRNKWVLKTLSRNESVVSDEWIVISRSCKPKQANTVDIRLRPRFCPLVSHFDYTPYWQRLCLADYGQT